LYHTKNYYNEQTSMPVRRAGVGTYYYMHTTASGKALLAERSEKYVHDVLDRWGLPAQTNNTITDRAELLREVDEIRQRGYATTDEEFTEGNRSIAMAVTGPDGDPIGSLAITGPTYRFREENLHNYLPSILKEQVAQIESTLGK
jgi:DNA-binding IclR family transcriptional regulator